ncbi:MAG TPA: hypothetical protein VL484_16360 [Vicinamibacterales bacterium]|jgi:Tol biopolymer transport system component|nr:hypothetical protein [Vicinamibacterales bacterium]
MGLSPGARLGAYEIVAQIGAGGHYDVFPLRVGGGHAIDLTAGAGGDQTQPAFSPDGEEIAFRSDRDLRQITHTSNGDSPPSAVMELRWWSSTRRSMPICG